MLDEHARELGAEIRRGHEVVGSQPGRRRGDRGRARPGRAVPGAAPATWWAATARTAGSATLAGIAFPGTTYPEVNRLAQVTVPDSVTLLDDGDLDVPGLGRIHAGLHPDRAAACSRSGSSHPGVLMIQTTEDEPADARRRRADDPGRVPGQHPPRAGRGAARGRGDRLSRYGFQARQAERYRDGRILLAGDAAHQFPATGIGINVGMLDAVNLGWKLAADLGGWAPAGLLDTYHHERHFAGARAMLQTQAQVALRRGQDPAAEALRELFPELLADEQPRRRSAR